MLISKKQQVLDLVKSCNFHKAFGIANPSSGLFGFQNIELDKAKLSKLIQALK